MNFSACLDCCRCVHDPEEPYMWICELGHLALPDKHECKDQLTKSQRDKTMKVYCSHSIQGKYGKDATETQMKENCEAMIELAEQLRKALLDIEFYVPAEHEDFVHIAYKSGYLMIDEILEIDCLIIDDCDAVIVLVPEDDELQGGRKVEYDYAIDAAIPAMVYSKVGEAIEWLAHQQMTR